MCVSVSVGQAVANRIGSVLKQATTKLTADMVAYNKLSDFPPSGSLPTKLSFEEVANPASECFVNAALPDTGSNHSAKVKRQIVAACKKLKRAVEEEAQVEVDCSASLNFFRNQHAKILSALKHALRADEVAATDEGEIDFHIVALSSQPQGQVAFLFNKLWAIEREVHQFLATLGQENTFCNVASDFVLAGVDTVYEQADVEEDQECVHDLMEELSDQPDAQAVFAPVFDEIMNT